MTTEHTSWMKQSFKEWGDKTPSDQYPGDHKIVIGCLQRIAIALERLVVISDKLTPEGQKKEIEQEERRRVVESFRQWDQVESQAAWTLVRRIEQLHDIPSRLKSGVRNACEQALPEVKNQRVAPTEDDRDLFRQFAETVAISEIPWETLGKTKSIRWLRETFPKCLECSQI